MLPDLDEARPMGESERGKALVVGGSSNISLPELIILSARMGWVVKICPLLGVALHFYRTSINGSSCLQFSFVLHHDHSR